MISFKNMLFDSKFLDKNCHIPIAEFRQIRSSHDNGLIKDAVSGTEEIIFKEIGVQGHPGMLDLNRFNDLVDLYVYVPIKDKEDKKTQQASPAIHYILSQNTKDKASQEPRSIPSDQVHL